MLTRQQIQDLIEQCADIAADLRDADPADMASTYRKLGLRLTYRPGIWYKPQHARNQGI
jgi:hypothetical protein